MGIEGLTGRESDALKIRAGYDPAKEVAVSPESVSARTARAGSRSKLPQYEMSFWTGLIVADGDGVYYPDVRRVTAAEGMDGCDAVVRTIVDPEAPAGYREETILDYSKRIDKMCGHPSNGGKGWLRADHIIGHMPGGMRGWEGRQSLRDYSDRILEPENLAAFIEGSGATVNLEDGIQSRPDNLYSLVDNYNPRGRKYKALSRVIEEEVPKGVAKCRAQFQAALDLIEARKAAASAPAPKKTRKARKTRKAYTETSSEPAEAPKAGE